MINRQTLPSEALNKLSFLLGRFVGAVEMITPRQERANFEFACLGSRHLDERWLSLQVVGKVPGLGLESRHDFITWDPAVERYRWILITNFDAEPIRFEGAFRNGLLELHSEIWHSQWGETQLKAIVTPLEYGSWVFDMFTAVNGVETNVASMMAMPDIGDPQSSPI